MYRETGKGLSGAMGVAGWDFVLRRCVWQGAVGGWVKSGGGGGWWRRVFWERECEEVEEEGAWFAGMGGARRW